MAATSTDKRDQTPTLTTGWHLGLERIIVVSIGRCSDSLFDLKCELRSEEAKLLDIGHLKTGWSRRVHGFL